MVSSFEVKVFFLNRDGLEVAVVYYRAGYSPKHYPTEKVQRQSIIKAPILKGNSIYFPCISKVTQQCRCSYFELGLPVYQLEGREFSV